MVVLAKPTSLVARLSGMADNIREAWLSGRKQRTANALNLKRVPKVRILPPPQSTFLIERPRGLEKTIKPERGLYGFGHRKIYLCRHILL